MKQPRLYDNEKGLCFKFCNYCTILHLLHKVPLLNQSITREPRPATGRLQVLPLEGAEGDKTTVVDFSPKAITTNELHPGVQALGKCGEHDLRIFKDI